MVCNGDYALLRLASSLATLVRQVGGQKYGFWKIQHPVVCECFLAFNPGYCLKIIFIVYHVSMMVITNSILGGMHHFREKLY